MKSIRDVADTVILCCHVASSFPNILERSFVMNRLLFPPFSERWRSDNDP